MESLLERREQSLALLRDRAAAAGSALLEPKEKRLAIAAGKLSALNPMGVLARGYTVTMGEKGICLAAGELAQGEEIVTLFRDGRVRSKVTEIQTDGGIQEGQLKL